MAEQPVTGLVLWKVAKIPKLTKATRGMEGERSRQRTGSGDQHSVLVPSVLRPYCLFVLDDPRNSGLLLPISIAAYTE